MMTGVVLPSTPRALDLDGDIVCHDIDSIVETAACRTLLH